MPSSDETPTPVAALLLLWEHWRDLTGRCPACRGMVVGTSFGGMLSFGKIDGCCVDCAESLSRTIGTYGQFRSAVHSVLDDTPYRLWTRCDFPGGWRMEGCQGALVPVLQELGASELPDWSAGLCTASLPRFRSVSRVQTAHGGGRGDATLVDASYGQRAGPVGRLG